MRKILLRVLCLIAAFCAVAGAIACKGDPAETEGKFTITYQSGEGAGRAYSVETDAGEHTLLTYTELNFTAPDGKEFDYWQIGNPETAKKQAGDKITVSANVTIVAIWKNTGETPPSQQEYVVTYQPGEGSGTISSVTVAAGEYTLPTYTEVNFTSPAAEYEFDYWQIGNPETAKKQAGDKITVSANVTIVAIWREVIVTDAETTLAIGKTIDLGSLFTDVTLGKDVTWQITRGSDLVSLSVGGDNVQAVRSGTAVLKATANGGDTYSVKLECRPAATVEEAVDFVVEVPTGRDIKVLQITDTQLVDSTQASMSGLNDLYKPEKFEENCFKYIREAVNRTNPDLIIMTGDNVWGSFDDNGSALTALIGVLDGFGIPWAAVYGNHDNESEKGAIWQNEQYQFSENGLFLRGVTDGNGNYTVGLKQGGEVKRVFFMMDTNLCSGAFEPEVNHVTTTMGFTDGQVNWFERTSAAILAADAGVKVSMAYHVPNYAYTQAMQQYDASLNGTYYYTLGLDVAARDGDFGSSNLMGYNNAGGVIDYVNNAVKTYGGKTLVEIFKAANVDSTFVGHQHDISLSMVYEGIRWTFGLKTGIYDVTNRQNLGGTLITVGENDAAVSVKHVYYDEDYQAYRDELPQNVTFGGAVIAGKDQLIYPQTPQRTGVVKEYIAGYGAYRIDSVVQGYVYIDKSLIADKQSVTFSFYVPSSSTARLGWPISAFAVMQRGSGSTYYYQPYSETGTETSSDSRNVNYNYDEWTTVTVDLKVNGERCSEVFGWVIAPGNAIYIKDVSFTDLPEKSELPVNITVKKDGVEDAAATAVTDGVKSELAATYYTAGDVLDIKDYARKYTPAGYRLDVSNSVLSVTVPESGSIDFVVAYYTYVEEPVVGTGNLVTTLLSDGNATSYLSSDIGELFVNGETLIFNCKNPSYANRIVFDSEFVKECFTQGYTNIKIKYYVSALADGAWIKIGPQIKNGTTFNYLSARSSQPWLSMSYTIDNMVETIWEITPYELSCIDFDNGDKLAIEDLGAGSTKTQVVITHIEFCQPNKAYNLLSDVNLFNETSGVMATGEVCPTGDCWQQYLDISASDAEKYGYTGKYINLYRHGWDESFIYFKKDFLDAMLNLGYTKLTVVTDGTATNGVSAKVRYCNYTPSNSKSTFSEIKASDAVKPGELLTFTYDLKDTAISDYLSINVGGNLAVKLYIYEISFSK